VDPVKNAKEMSVLISAVAVKHAMTMVYVSHHVTTVRHVMMLLLNASQLTALSAKTVTLKMEFARK